MMLRVVAVLLWLRMVLCKVVGQLLLLLLLLLCWVLGIIWQGRVLLVVLGLGRGVLLLLRGDMGRGHMRQLRLQGCQAGLSTLQSIFCSHQALH